MKQKNSENISIIVVLYYSQHLIKDLLKNISDTIENVNEIIFVNNSSDSLKEINQKSIKIISPAKNLGYGGAINLAVKSVTNELIVILNPDVFIKKFTIPQNININDFFILSGVLSEWEDMKGFPNIIDDFLNYSFGNLSKIFKKPYKKIHINKNIAIQEVDWISGALIVTNKKTFNSLGGFNESFFLFYEEVDLCKRAFTLNFPVYITNSISFDSNLGTSSSKNVSAIKLKAVIESAQLYHTLYSGKKITYLLFFILKLHSWLISRGLKLIFKLTKNKKIYNKSKQYRIYFRNIKL